MQIRAGTKLVQAANHVGQAHARMELHAAPAVHVALQAHRSLETVANGLHAQHVAGLDAGRAALRRGEVEVDHRAITTLIDAFEPGRPRVGLRHQATREIQQLRRLRTLLQLVDRRAAHFAGDRGGDADGRDEDHVARQQPRVVAGVAIQQQVVQVELLDDLSAALELDVTQRPDGRDAAARKQGVGDRRQSADRVGARLRRLTEYEHLDGAQRADRDVGPHADHLLGHALLEQVLHGGKAHASHCDGAEFGEVDHAIAAYRQRELAAALADELHLERVTGTHHVVGGNRDVRGWRKGGGHVGKEVVAKGPQHGLDREHTQPETETLQLGIRVDPRHRFGGRQASQGKRRAVMQRELADTIEAVGVTREDALAKLDTRTVVLVGNVELEQHRIPAAQARNLLGHVQETPGNLIAPRDGRWHGRGES